MDYYVDDVPGYVATSGCHRRGNRRNITILKKAMISEVIQIAPRATNTFERIMQDCCSYLTRCIRTQTAIDIYNGIVEPVRTALQAERCSLVNVWISDTDDENVIQVYIEAQACHSVTHIHMNFTVDTNTGAYESRDSAVPPLTTPLLHA